MDKQCGSCRFQKVYEWEKPCMGYREGCHLYQKGEDMTRDEAIKELSEMRTDAWTDGRQMEALSLAIKALSQAQKTGHWIEKDGFDGDVYYDCSECGESWATIEGTPWDNEWNYCPNCGTKMESDHKCHNCKHYLSGEYDGSCDSYICEHYSGWESEDKE